MILFTTVSSWCLPAGFEETVWVANGLDQSPMSMTFAPDGRLFVVQADGTVRIVKEGKLLPAPFLQVQPYASHRERMLGLAFDPKFAENGFVYLLYQKNAPNRISRFTVSKTNENVCDPGSEKVILESGIGGGGGHNGGAFGFGKDGMLYAAAEHMVRINPAAYPDIIPKDNPQVDGAPSAAWASGFREPFSGAMDTVTGAIVVNDVGEGGKEEANLIHKGANYGYPTCEGSCANPKFTNPWFEYPHSEGRCIAGGAFYYGGQFGAEYRGNYFFGDEAEGWIRRRTSDGRIQDFSTGKSVIDLDVGPDGNLYALRIPGEPPPNPWKGTITRIRNTTAPASLPSQHASGDQEGLGPDPVSLRSCCGEGIRFRLGKNTPLTGSIRIYDRLGHQVWIGESGRGGNTLEWRRPAQASAGRVFFYVLRVLPMQGAAIEKRGRFLLQP